MTAAAVLMSTISACAAADSSPAAGPAATTSSMSGQSMTRSVGMTHTAWTQLSITDSQGKTFTIGDLAGKPVFLEFFATWCPSCRAQLAKTNQAAEQAGSKAVFLAISVETDLSAADMAKYKSDNKFNAVAFAVMTPDMLSAVVAAFGHDAANPPSTPHVVVSSDGAVGDLSTGPEDPASIVASLGSP